jgi:hypothetical protein
MKLYLLRHGLTEYNAKHYYQGKQDLPLSDEGRARLAKADFDMDVVYVTPLMRTAQTAEILFPNARLEVVEGLKEMDFGIFGNPVDVPGMANQLSVNFYLDNVTVEVYEGAAENGLQSEDSIKAAEDKAAFDFATAKGLVFDMNEDKDEFAISATSYEYAGGNLVVTSEGENADPTITFKNAGVFTADKYNAVAVRFKAEGVEESQRHIVVYFATEADGTLSQSKSITVKYDLLEVDEEGYYIAYIPMTENAAWDGQITILRVDPGNSKGLYTIDKILVVEK